MAEEEKKTAAEEQAQEQVKDTGADTASETAAAQESAQAQEPQADAPAGDDKKTAALQEKIDSLEDRVKRQMAEFENFRRRTDKEKESMFSMGERSVLEKMLPILDNFERGLATIPEEQKDDAFAQGMDKVYRQMLKTITDLGVTPIEAVGKDFDPNFHNAVMQVESDEYESGKVAQEFQKGYLYHDTVLRHSMVGVVK